MYNGRVMEVNRRLIEIRHRSVIPFYGAAIALILYALFLPLYRIWDYLIFLAVGAGAFFLLQKLFPGTVEKIEVPVTTGDDDTDALLREGADVVVEDLAELVETWKSTAGA